VSDPIPVNLAVEDSLSEYVLRKIIRRSNKRFAIGRCIGRTGFGYLKRAIYGFNHASKNGICFCVLTDLDTTECPPALIQRWLPDGKHPNLIFRIAVREVESWLLAHREAFAKYIGISEDLIPLKVEDIENPKQFLIGLVSRSRTRQLRSDIVPRTGSTATIGPDYNGRLIEFVERTWDPHTAKKLSASLRSAIEAIETFDPI
jgi:hypothetical protein